MADFYFDVDVALSKVPVNILPLLDDTDFKTIEDAVAYNAAGMALFWHFVTSAGVYTVTAVTPTTAGVHDWTDQGTAGVYTIEIPASAGTVNNDTEGYGWFTGKATGVLPWRGPTIGFRAAAVNDALCDGGDILDVSVTQLLGTAWLTPGVAGTPDVNAKQFGGAPVTATTSVTFSAASTVASTTNITAGTVTTATNVTTVNGLAAGVVTSAAIATGAIDADALAADAVTEIWAGSTAPTAATITAAVWNEDATAHQALGTFGQAIGDPGVNSSTIYGAAVSGDAGTSIAAILEDTDQIGVAGAGLTAINLPNQTMDIVGNITGNLSGSVGSVTGLTASNLDATISSRATPGQVNAEVVDALATDTYAEPGQGTPSATTSLAAKINYLYKAFLNKVTQTATTQSLFNNAATVVDQKATVSDDGTTFTRTNVTTGP